MEGENTRQLVTFFFFSSNLLTFDKLNEMKCVLSLKQHNSLFKLRFCTVKFDRSGQSFLLVPNKYGTFESEYLQASDKANI